MPNLRSQSQFLLRFKMLIPAILIILQLVPADFRYNGYKVYSVIAKSEQEQQVLKVLKSRPHYDFWSEINSLGDPISVMVSPKKQKDFEDSLKRQNVTYFTKIQNVQEVLPKARNNTLEKSLQEPLISFGKYYSFDQINIYLKSLSIKYPQLARIQSIGKSYEGREMNILRIKSPVNNLSKIKIFIDAGMHAREWIAPATALYLINQLVENYATNFALLANVEWIILPVMNPDGYEYSRNVRRLWRKTRSRGWFCRGADANRNFDYHWRESGSSWFECSNTYAGRSAFSEIETKNLKNLLLNESNVQAYVSLHSYGNLILYPWGYGNQVPSHWSDLNNLGNKMADAIRAVSGTFYRVGNSAKVLYPAAGGSDDWAMGVAKIPISYTLELPAGGALGFDLPESEILSVVQETFEAFKVLADYVVNKYRSEV